MERMATIFHLCKVSAVLHLSMKSTWVSPEDLLEPRNHVVYPFSFCHHFLFVKEQILLYLWTCRLVLFIWMVRAFKAQIHFPQLSRMRQKIAYNLLMRGVAMTRLGLPRCFQCTQRLSNARTSFPRPLHPLRLPCHLLHHRRPLRGGSCG